MTRYNIVLSATLIATMLLGCNTTPAQPRQDAGGGLPTTADAVVTPSPVAVQAPIVTPPVWTYSETRDEMRNASTYIARLASTNRLNFAFPYHGGSTAHIIFRQSPRDGFDAMVSVSSGQFTTCFMDCSIRVKFDDGPVQTLKVVGTDSGNAQVLFLRSGSDFMARVRRASRIVIEADFYQAGSVQMVFEPSAPLVWPRPGMSSH